MSQNVPLRLLVTMGRAAVTEAGGQQGDELSEWGLVEHHVILPRGRGNV